MKNQAFLQRLRYATAGIVHATASEASFKTQLLLSVLAATVLALVRPPLVWLGLCVLSASSVLALELLNTALEHLADRLHPELHESIQLAKDCAAGAVLVASIAALIIGALAAAVGLHWIRAD